MNYEEYKEQTELMLQILPLVMKEKEFALKGGTAINFFFRDMPRLSVDIDLTYLPITNRDETLFKIDENLNKICDRVSELYPSYKINKKCLKGDKNIAFKLSIHNSKTQIKIEPNLILRGACYPPVTKNLCELARSEFKKDISCLVMSSEDIYGGKICAALDRQHPRDLFDIKNLFKCGGITETMLETFVVYLASGGRPMVELLNPNFIDLKKSYDSTFKGMTSELVTVEELERTRIQLVDEVQKGLTYHQRKFLLSLKEGVPKYELLSISHVSSFPAIKWKLLNIKKMSVKDHEKVVNKLQI